MAGTIVIFDSEWTTWEGAWERNWNGPGEQIEIVQVGFVKLADTPALREIEHLEFLVRPTRNPELSDYFIDLTGIDQATLDRDGVPFSRALARIVEFLDADVRVVHCFGRDGRVLRRNCVINKLEFPFRIEFFQSIMPAFSDFTGVAVNKLVSSHLPALMGFEPPGDAHTALADARCIAEGLRIMRRAGAF